MPKKYSWIPLCALLGITSEATTMADNDKKTTLMEPNPPHWPDSVKLIHPNFTAPEIQEVTREAQDPYDAVHNTYTSDRHFTSERFAILFYPGVYDQSVDIEVGYYTQVLGLGRTPQEVLR